MSLARCRWADQRLVAVIIGVITLGFAMGGDPAWEALRYERSAIIEGELWRLVTGHWVHLGWSHLAVNLAGLLLVWSLWGRALQNLQWLVCILWIALAQSLLLLALNPEIHWYVGLSGLLHGLFAVGALLQLRSDPLVGGVALAVLTGKLLLEALNLSGGTTIPGIDQVVEEAHLYGAVSGVVCGSYYWYYHVRNHS